jgi:signal transduction histidine kinase
MRLKTKLVLAISALVVTLVATLSSIYISYIVRQRITADKSIGVFVSQEITQAAEDALQVDLSNEPNPAAEHDEIIETLQTDPGLNSLLQSVVGYSPIIYDAEIVDADGKVLLSTNANDIGKILEARDDFEAIVRQSSWRQLRWVYGKPQVYEIRVLLKREGNPFGAVRVGISTVFLKNELEPQLNRALEFSLIAVLVSLVLAAALSNLALRPLETIARRLDAMTAAHIGPTAVKETARTRRDEVGVVTSKIDRLGREIRDVKEVFSALKENLDQIMGNLQDGIMLFTRDLRAVLVSASAETFINKRRGEVLGQEIDAVFNDDTALGRLVLAAIASHQPLVNREIETENRRRVQISLDFIEERGERIGALLTMRDAESVRQIENEIELSRRLAAIGRLTSGVAHEVKNPINAIVVHLEILRQKLQEAEPDVRRHVNVIGNEIQRLDRVVQMLVDFTRPVELRLTDADIRRIIDDVIVLSSPDAERHSVKLVRQLPAEPLITKLDVDLVKQAVLNVVLNGVQAMPDGGTLTISARRDERGMLQLDIQDTGQGIPPEIQARIFDLYFTTKESGSGIGLAMTFRVMQLHNGSVDFDTGAQGTTFHLRFPAAESRDVPQELAARTEARA